LRGKHTRTRLGITDMETEDSIIEIKVWKCFKQVVGQLKAYDFKKEEKKCLVAAFYGEATDNFKRDAVEFVNSQQINVIELIDCADGSIVIKDLGKNVGVNGQNEQNEQKINDIPQSDRIKQFISENLEKVEGQSVKVKEVLHMFDSSLKTHNHRDAKLMFCKYLGKEKGENQSRAYWNNWTWKSQQDVTNVTNMHL